MRRARERGGSAHPFFAGSTPRVIAHRGLHTHAAENTLSAFRAAVELGATHLETDVRGTADGEAVLFHDETLHRVAGRSASVSESTSAELAALDLGFGEGVPTLSALLECFPDARFNIDVKDDAALAPAVSAIRGARAEDRVLITSFSPLRQRLAARALPDAATSPGWDRILAGVLAARNGYPRLVRRVFSDVDAIQFPPRSHGIGFLGPRVLEAFQGTGCELHVWTVNCPDMARALFLAGIDGVFTDRVDAILPVADEAR